MHQPSCSHSLYSKKEIRHKTGSKYELQSWEHCAVAIQNSATHDGLAGLQAGDEILFQQQDQMNPVTIK